MKKKAPESRRRKPGPPGKAGGKPRRRTGGGRRLRWRVLVPAVVAASIAIAWVLYRRSVVGKTEFLTPAEYEARGQSLRDSSAATAALVYEEALRHYPESFELRFNLAAVHANETYDPIARLGAWTGPRLPSGQRVAIARLALSEFKALAADHPQRIEPHVGMALLYSRWGFSYEALEEHRQAFMLGDRGTVNVSRARRIVEIEAGHPELAEGHAP